MVRVLDSGIIWKAEPMGFADGRGQGWGGESQEETPGIWRSVWKDGVAFY
jgi:hypothetical protein